MPNALLQKLSADMDIPISELETKWDKAKEITGKKFDKADQSYWPYVHGVFNNMLGVSTSASPPQWWLDLNQKARQKYLQLHQNSPLVRYLDRKVRQAKRVGTAYGKFAHRQVRHQWRKKRHKVVMKLIEHKHGLKNLHYLIMGGAGNLTDEEKQSAVKTAKLLGKIVLGTALAGVVAYAGLQPFADVIGKHYYDSIRDNFFAQNSEPEAGNAAHDDMSKANSVSEHFMKWLTSQDPKKLEQDLKKKYPEIGDRK